MPSGACVEVVTDSTSIEVHVQLTRLAYGDEAPRPAPFDLVVDGERLGLQLVDAGHLFHFPDRSSPDMRFVGGEAAAVRFADLAPGPKHVQVWLPHTASVELLDVLVDDGADAADPPGAARRWVHYGSSISHCVEAERPTEVWPAIVARRAGVELLSLAIAGQCHLDQLVARTIRDLDVDVLSMKVGINVVNGDTLRERSFVPALHGFLDTIRDGQPDLPIVVATPIICPIVERHPGPTTAGDSGRFRAAERTRADIVGSLTLERIRELVTAAVSARRAGGDINLHLVSGLDLFGEDDVPDLYDDLHPTAEGYRRIADRFHALVFAGDGPFAARR
jgi:hypothetical protein